MTDDEVTALLWDWGRYWVAGNRGMPNRLIGSYAERIGAGSWGDNYAPHVDERIVWLASEIAKFDLNYRAALHIKYIEPGPLKAKLPVQWARNDYYTFLKAAHNKVSDVLADKNRVDNVQPTL